MNLQRLVFGLTPSTHPTHISEQAWSTLVRLVRLLESCPAQAITAPKRLRASMVAQAVRELTGDHTGTCPVPADVRADAEALAAERYQLLADDFAAAGLELARARSYVRALAGMLFDVTDPTRRLAHRLHGLIDNRNLTVPELVEVLDGDATELPLTTVGRIAALLRDGASTRQVSAETGVARRTVVELAALLHVDDARREQLEAHAFEAVVEGQSQSAFARTHGISRGRAAAMFDEQAPGVAWLELA